jgi:hypothetical protein
MPCEGSACPLSSCWFRAHALFSLGAMLLLDEADSLQLAAGLPPAARLWVLAIRARIMTIAGHFEAAVPICEEIARVTVEDPTTMQDPFSLYACYSIAFNIQTLESTGEAFASLWKLLRSMANVWPLAATLLGYVEAPAKSYAVCSNGASCVGKVMQPSVLRTFPFAVAPKLGGQLTQLVTVAVGRWKEPASRVCHQLVDVVALGPGGKHNLRSTCQRRR